MEFADFFWETTFAQLGCGKNGCAYDINGSQVLKITTNDKEAQISKWLVAHPHPSIAKYYKVWKDADKWMILMQKVNTKFPSKREIEKLRKQAERKGFTGVKNIHDYFSQHFMDHKYVPEVVNALTHILNSGLTFRDFLNPNNMGLVDGKLKLFDFN